MYILVILLIVLFVIRIIKEKIHVDWSTFTKKGFKKYDNAFGLFCYTGKQGKGKTYSSIKFIIDRKLKMKNKLVVVTNVTSFNAFKDIVYLQDISQIIKYSEDFIENEKDKPISERKKLLIFYDEIFTVLNKNTPIQKNILSFLSQLRKREIIFVTTAQEWSEINITFRRYVRYQINCNMFPFPLFKTAFLFNSINDGDLIRWNNDLQDFEAPRISANFSKALLSVVQSYDTFETIHTSVSFGRPSLPSSSAVLPRVKGH